MQDLIVKEMHMLIRKQIFFLLTGYNFKWRIVSVCMTYAGKVKKKGENI